MSVSNKTHTKCNLMKLVKKNGGLTLLALPGVIWFLIFAYMPMYGIIIAFKKFNFRKGIWGSDWNGLKNFEFLFRSNDALRIIRNTILYNGAFIIISTVCAIVIAILLDQVKKRRYVKFYQTTMFFPYLVSWVIVGYIARGLFSYDGGIMNRVMAALGKEPVMWYTTKNVWPIILIIMNLWKGIGYNSIMYYGSIMGIDSELFEAAEIDGAGRFSKVRYITLPLLKPTIIVLFIMSIGNMLRADFGLFYYIPDNSGALYAVTDVIDTYIYRALKVTGDFTGSSAVSFVQSVVGLFLVLLSNALIKKWEPENAMF